MNARILGKLVVYDSIEQECARHSSIESWAKVHSDNMDAIHVSLYS